MPIISSSYMKEESTAKCGQLNFGIDAGKDFGCHLLLKSIS